MGWSARLVNQRLRERGYFAITCPDCHKEHVTSTPSELRCPTCVAVDAALVAAPIESEKRGFA